MAGSTPRDALKGWKSIADYFGRDTSTVMRWAAQRGLPVRRLPGEGRSSVYALPQELAAWLATEASAVEPPITAPPPAAPRAAELPEQAIPAAGGTRRSFARRWPYAAAMAVPAVAIAAAVAWRAPPRAAPHPAFHDTATERAYLAATYDLSRRTPDSLARARAEFGAIIAGDPTAAPACAGLSETFLLLRQYSVFPDDEAYPRAAAAARAGLALDPDLVAAHRALAFVAFWHDRDIATARTEFGRALALDPKAAQTWHWYANALNANGEPAAAFDAIGTARRLAPESTPVAADYGLIAYDAGHRDEAMAALHAVASDTPAEPSSHHYLADIALVRGDGATYLAEAAIVCRLKRDAPGAVVVAADRAAFAAGGEAGLLAAMAARRARAVTATSGHLALAEIEALQGRRAAALADLRQAVAADEPGLVGLPSDFALDPLAGDPGFDRARRRDRLAQGAAS